MKMLSVLAEPFTRYQGEIYLTDRTLQSLAETTKHMELLVTSSKGYKNMTALRFLVTWIR